MSAPSLAAARSAAPGTTAPRVVLAVATLGVFMAFVDATIVNIAFPTIAADFHGASIASLQWVLNAYNIVFAAFLVASGGLADRLGRRRVFVTALGVFTVASALCAVAPTAGALIAARVLQALGAALLVPASLALVLQSFATDRRSHAVALWTAVAALAAGVGPLFGGLLISAAGWRDVFLVNLPIGVVAIVLALKLLPESRVPSGRRRPDVTGSALLALAIAAIVLATVQGGDWGWTSSRVLGAATVGGVLAALFAHRCRTHAAPLIDPGLFGVRAFRVANAATLLGGAGFFGYTLLNVLYLTEVWHYPVLRAGLALTPGPFVAAAVAGPASRMMGRHGPRAVIVPGALIWAGAVVWWVLNVGPTPHFVSQWLPGVLLSGMGAGLTFPTLSGVAVAAVPGEDFGTSSAINAVARQIGAAFGVAVVVAAVGRPTTLAQATVAFDRAWLVAAGLLVAAALAALAFGRPARSPNLQLVAAERQPA